MAVIVKLGGDDRKKRPAPKGSAAATAPIRSSAPSTIGGGWFRDRRILAGIGVLLVVMIAMWSVMNLQTSKPVEFPQTRATTDEFDPSKVTQPNQPPAYDPN